MDKIPASMMYFIAELNLWKSADVFDSYNFLITQINGTTSKIIEYNADTHHPICKTYTWINTTNPVRTTSQTAE